MIEVDVELTARDSDRVLVLIEAVLRDSGLVVSLTGTQKSYPNCSHWHLSKAGSKGVLELTWWPARSKLWFKVASNRSAPWVDEVLPELKGRLESALSTA